MNHPVGPAPFFGVRHLFRQNTCQALLRHPGPGENPLTLDETRCADYSNQITELMGLALQQQRHVQHDERAAVTAAVPQETTGSGADPRVHDRFKPA